MVPTVDRHCASRRTFAAWCRFRRSQQAHACSYSCLGQKTADDIGKRRSAEVSGRELFPSHEAVGGVDRTRNQSVTRRYPNSRTGRIQAAIQNSEIKRKSSMLTHSPGESLVTKWPVRRRISFQARPAQLLQRPLRPLTAGCRDRQNHARLT